MRDLALALFIFGLIPFVLMRPYVGLLLWTWLSYMNPYRLCYSFAATFPWNQIVAVATLVSLVFSKDKKRIPLSVFSILLFLFLVWTAVCTTFAAVPAAAWPQFEEFVKTIVMIFLTLMLVYDRERIHWLVWTVVISLGFYGLKGGVFTLLHGGNYHVYGPPNSFIANNNDMALALCVVLPLIRYLQLHEHRKIVRVGLGIGMLCTGVAVLGTYSRGGLIGLFVVAMALLLKGRRRIAVMLAVVVIGATAYHFMPPQWIERMDTLHHASQTDSAETRIQSWKFSANVAIHHPLTGGGFNNYLSPTLWQAYAPEGAVERAVHSVYFRVLGEQGFPGLVLFLSMLILSWYYCSSIRKASRHSQEKKWAYDLASMLQVSLLAYAVTGLASTLSYYGLIYQLMALCALLKHYLSQPVEQQAGSVGTRRMLDQSQAPHAASERA